MTVVAAFPTRQQINAPVGFQRGAGGRHGAGAAAGTLELIDVESAVGVGGGK
jgi:hypothetical protein